MLLVKTKIGLSKIQGIGLFADEFIPKGKVVWKFNKMIDLYLSKKDLKKLSPSSYKIVHNYFMQDKHNKKYLLCGDDARFMNHSDNENCDDTIKDKTIAIKNIKKGEELTINYKSCYGNIKEYPEIK